MQIEHRRSQVNIPKDHVANTHRGFGFVEFEVEGDAKAAVENMDGKFVPNVYFKSTDISCHVDPSTGGDAETG